MLFWHKHNINKSLADLPNFTPFPDEWTVEDKVLFEQAFSFHGKSFHRIQQMVESQSNHCTYTSLTGNFLKTFFCIRCSSQIKQWPVWFVSTTHGRKAAARQV